MYWIVVVVYSIINSRILLAMIALE